MKKHSLKKIILPIILLFIIISQTACTSNTQNNINTNQGVSKTGFYLDTMCEITIYQMRDDMLSDYGKNQSPNYDELEKQYFEVITDAFKECDRYEKFLSKTIEGSDIARINNANGEFTSVSDETIEVIKKGIKYGEISDGAFDITIGKASKLWDFHDDTESGHETNDESKLPDKNELKEAVKHIDYQKVEIQGNNVRLKDRQAEIDLGGIAKGYIADKVAEYLEKRGVVSAVVDLGGNIVAIGGKGKSLICDTTEDLLAEGDRTESDTMESTDLSTLSDAQTDFRLGILDPMSKRGELLGVLPARDKTIVTSGTYERYFEYKGKKYHHILDPKTGYPKDTDVLSVSIISGRGHSADCDGISTTCLAIGVRDGVKLIKTLNESKEFGDIYAVFVDKNGKITVTDETLPFEKNR